MYPLPPRLLFMLAFVLRSTRGVPASSFVGIVVDAAYFVAPEQDSLMVGTPEF